jgi:hypothetical protein
VSKKMDIEELVKEVSVYTYMWLPVIYDCSANMGLINIGKAW